MLKLCIYSVVAWGGAGGTWVPPIILTGTFNLVSGQALVPIHQVPTFTLLFCSMCSFQLDKAWKLFIYGFNKEKLSAQSTLLKWEINTLGRLKMPFQRPYSSKFSRGACPRTSLAARAFGARDSPHPPANLATALIYELGLNFVINNNNNNNNFIYTALKSNNCHRVFFIKGSRLGVKEENWISFLFFSSKVTLILP